MPLQAEEEQPPCKLNLQAEANNFDLRIKATKAWPAARNFFQFTLRLKLSPVDISVKLKPKTSIWFFNSKFLLKKKKKKKFLQSFRMRFAKYRAIAARRSFNIILPRRNALPIKGWNCGSSGSLLVNLALLWKWIYEKHQNGILTATTTTQQCFGPASQYISIPCFTIQEYGTQKTEHLIAAFNRCNV